MRKELHPLMRRMTVVMRNGASFNVQTVMRTSAPYALQVDTTMHPAWTDCGRGYSCVYLAEEVVGEGTSCGGPRYALKRIACGGREQLAEANKEIDVMQSLEHPNILVLKGHAVVAAKAGPATEIVYMLFDVYDGNMWDIVQKRMEAGRPLRQEEVMHIFGGLCRALQAMHGRYSHRDVKPHNIMLRRKRGDWDDVSDADVVLMDFGSVQAAEQRVDSRRDALKVQEDAERYTTAPYRAPELWEVPSNSVIDCKVDVWAAGCVLYYLLVGETPFERIANEAGGSLMLAVLNGSYSWPTRRGNEVPEKFKNIVDACLQPHASNRPSIDSVLFMLEGAIQPPQHATTTSTPNLIDL
eukprot:jgi/Picre1/29144/NNA_004537.t1